MLPLLIITVLSGWIAQDAWRREPDMLIGRSAHAVVANADAIYALAGSRYIYVVGGESQKRLMLVVS